VLVTLFTDASFNRQMARGVWAAWAKADGQTIRYSGAIKGSMPDIAECELAAIANGLFAAKAKFAPPFGSKIIIATDSAEAIASIKNRNHPRVKCRFLTNYIHALAQEQSWTLDIRHVKGRRGAATPRNAVNTWCDKECRRLMGLLLASSKTETATQPTQQELKRCRSSV
jgi:ribonuclease HI